MTVKRLTADHAEHLLKVDVVLVPLKYKRPVRFQHSPALRKAVVDHLAPLSSFKPSVLLRHLCVRADVEKVRRVEYYMYERVISERKRGEVALDVRHDLAEPFGFSVSARPDHLAFHDAVVAV